MIILIGKTISFLQTRSEPNSAVQSNLLLGGLDIRKFRMGPSNSAFGGTKYSVCSATGKQMKVSYRPSFGAIALASDRMARPSVLALAR